MFGFSMFLLLVILLVPFILFVWLLVSLIRYLNKKREKL